MGCREMLTDLSAERITHAKTAHHQDTCDAAGELSGELRKGRQRSWEDVGRVGVFVGGAALHPAHLPSADVEQMAIDWLTGNFYFVDDIDDRIFVCNRNGDTCVTLLDLELYNPKGIALDPAMG